MDMHIWAALMDLPLSERNRLFRSLTPREEKIFRRHYGFDRIGAYRFKTKWPLTKLAEHYQVSKVRIIQIVDKAERKLRHKTRLNITYNYS